MMSDRERLIQALLLHLWWPHSKVSLRPGDKRGNICTLQEELRAFRGARVRITPNYLLRTIAKGATAVSGSCIMYPLVLKGEYLHEAWNFVEYRCVLNIPAVK